MKSEYPEVTQEVNCESAEKKKKKNVCSSLLFYFDTCVLVKWLWL